LRGFQEKVFSQHAVLRLTSKKGFFLFPPKGFAKKFRPSPGRVFPKFSGISPRAPLKKVPLQKVFKKVLWPGFLNRKKVPFL